jgi:hypothetical protein
MLPPDCVRVAPPKGCHFASRTRQFSTLFAIFSWSTQPTFQAPTPASCGNSTPIADKSRTTAALVWFPGAPIPAPLTNLPTACALKYPLDGLPHLHLVVLDRDHSKICVRMGRQGRVRRHPKLPSIIDNTTDHPAVVDPCGPTNEGRLRLFDLPLHTTVRGQPGCLARGCCGR